MKKTDLTKQHDAPTSITRDDQIRFGYLERNIAHAQEESDKNELASNELQKELITLQLKINESRNKLEDVYIDISKALIVVLTPACIAIPKINGFNGYSYIVIGICLGLIAGAFITIRSSLGAKRKLLDLQQEDVTSFLSTLQDNANKRHESLRRQMEIIQRDYDYFERMIKEDKK